MMQPKTQGPNNSRKESESLHEEMQNKNQKRGDDEKHDDESDRNRNNMGEERLSVRGGGEKGETDQDRQKINFNQHQGNMSSTNKYRHMNMNMFMQQPREMRHPQRPLEMRQQNHEMRQQQEMEEERTRQFRDFLISRQSQQQRQQGKSVQLVMPPQPNENDYKANSRSREGGEERTMRKAAGSSSSAVGVMTKSTSSEVVVVGNAESLIAGASSGNNREAEAEADIRLADDASGSISLGADLEEAPVESCDLVMATARTSIWDQNKKDGTCTPTHTRRRSGDAANGDKPVEANNDNSRIQVTVKDHSTSTSTSTSTSPATGPSGAFRNQVVTTDVTCSPDMIRHSSNGGNESEKDDVNTTTTTTCQDTYTSETPKEGCDNEDEPSGGHRNKDDLTRETGVHLPTIRIMTAKIPMGVVIKNVNKSVQVIEVSTDGSSYGKIFVGDKITHIDGIAVRSVKAFMKIARKKKNSEVKLTIESHKIGTDDNHKLIGTKGQGSNEDTNKNDDASPEPEPPDDPNSKYMTKDNDPIESQHAINDGKNGSKSERNNVASCDTSTFKENTCEHASGCKSVGEECVKDRLQRDKACNEASKQDSLGKQFIGKSLGPSAVLHDDASRSDLDTFASLPSSTEASQPHGKVMEGVQQHQQQIEMALARLWPPPANSESDTRELEIRDAQNYLRQIRIEFSSRPRVYNEFLGLLKKFRANELDISALIIRVIDLFRGNKKLILGLNAFLPDGFDIKANDLEEGGKYASKKGQNLNIGLQSRNVCTDQDQQQGRSSEREECIELGGGQESRPLGGHIARRSRQFSPQVLEKNMIATFAVQNGDAFESNSLNQSYSPGKDSHDPIFPQQNNTHSVSEETVTLQNELSKLTKCIAEERRLRRVLETQLQESKSEYKNLQEIHNKQSNEHHQKCNELRSLLHEFKEATNHWKAKYMNQIDEQQKIVIQSSVKGKIANDNSSLQDMLVADDFTETEVSHRSLSQHGIASDHASTRKDETPMLLDNHMKRLKPRHFDSSAERRTGRDSHALNKPGSSVSPNVVTQNQSPAARIEINTQTTARSKPAQNGFHGSRPISPNDTPSKRKYCEADLASFLSMDSLICQKQYSKYISSSSIRQEGKKFESKKQKVAKRKRLTRSCKEKSIFGLRNLSSGLKSFQPNNERCAQQSGLGDEGGKSESAELPKKRQRRKLPRLCKKSVRNDESYPFLK